MKARNYQVIVVYDSNELAVWHSSMSDAPTARALFSHYASDINNPDVVPYKGVYLTKHGVVVAVAQPTPDYFLGSYVGNGG